MNRKIVKKLLISVISPFLILLCCNESSVVNKESDNSEQIELCQSIGLRYSPDKITVVKKREFVSGQFNFKSVRRTNSNKVTGTAVLEVILQGKSSIIPGLNDKTIFPFDDGSDFPTSFELQLATEDGESLLPSGSDITSGQWVIVTITVSEISKTPFEVWFGLESKKNN